jgi:hypothetical protein
MFTVCSAIDLADMNNNCRDYWTAKKATHNSLDQIAWCTKFGADLANAKVCSTLVSVEHLRYELC